MKNILIKILDKLLVNKSLDDTDDVYPQLNLFGDVFEKVRLSYVEEVDYKELIEDAINGMLAGLDPHSSYLSPENWMRWTQVETRESLVD
jgi:carboxyl-terminal processing protease